MENQIGSVGRTVKNSPTARLVSRQFKLQFTYFDERAAFKKNLYAIYNVNKRFQYGYLLAILNSKFFSYIHVNLNTSGQRDDFPAFSLQDYRNFLIPDTGNKQDALTVLANKILSLTNDGDYEDNSAKQSKVREYDKEIDRIVYDLYGLTKKEIEIVEKSFKNE